MHGGPAHRQGVDPEAAARLRPAHLHLEPDWNGVLDGTGMGLACHPPGAGEDAYGVALDAPHPRVFRIPELAPRHLQEEWTYRETSETTVEEVEVLVDGVHIRMLDCSALANRLPRERPREELPDLLWNVDWQHAPALYHPGCLPCQPWPSFLCGRHALQILVLLVEAWDNGVRQDPRRILASAEARVQRTRREQLLLLRGKKTAGAILPGCSWCAFPTPCWCDGSERTCCGLPLCMRCEAIFVCCRRCAVATGIPKGLQAFETRTVEREAVARAAGRGHGDDGPRLSFAAHLRPGERP